MNTTNKEQLRKMLAVDAETAAMHLYIVDLLAKNIKQEMDYIEDEKTNKLHCIGVEHKITDKIKTVIKFQPDAFEKEFKECEFFITIENYIIKEAHLTFDKADFHADNEATIYDKKELSEIFGVIAVFNEIIDEVLIANNYNYAMTADGWKEPTECEVEINADISFNSFRKSYQKTRLNLLNDGIRLNANAQEVCNVIRW